MKTAVKTGRNDPCPCGSGKKFKLCHGFRASQPVPAALFDANKLVVTGLNLQKSGDLDQAEVIYRKVLAAAPKHPNALHLLGLLKHQKGNSREAVALIERAIAARPEVAEFHNNCGEAYRAVGRFAEAISQYDHALKLSPDFAEAFVNRGVVQKIMGDIAGAEESYRAALKIRPDWPQAHVNLANLLRGQGLYADAEAEYKQALGGRSGDAQLYNDLGALLIQNRDGAQAKSYLNRALELDPQNPELLSNLGMAHELLRDTREAIRLYEEALTLGSQSPMILRNLGLALYSIRDIPRSIEAYERGLKLAPEDADTHVNLAFSLFSAGDLPQAWEHYAWGAKQHAELSRSHVFMMREWKGEEVRENSLLVWADQGVGDEMWFASMYPDLQRRVDSDGRLIIECAPKLQRLFQRSFQAATVVASQNPPHPAAKEATVQIPARNLGRHMRARIEDFPVQSQYLFGEAGRIQHWRRKLDALGSGLKVGVCWRSSNATGRRAESVTAISEWGEILRVPGVEFINLQYDECRAELELAKTSFGAAIHHFDEVDMYDDLDETAALVTALDLVISAPTSVSVLAPALGVPTWQLNYIEDWRAFGRDANPWYPSLKSWTRNWDEGWSSVLGRIANELRRLAQRSA